MLLSAGTYHSPMHLIIGDCRVVMAPPPPGGGGGGSQKPERSLLLQPGADPAPAAAAAAAVATGVPLQGDGTETYWCSRGFDARKGVAVPLRRVLQGL